MSKEMEDIDKQLLEIRKLLKASADRVKKDPKEAEPMTEQIEGILKTQAANGQFLIGGEWVAVKGMELVKTEVQYDENDDKIGITVIYKTIIPQIEIGVEPNGVAG